MKTLENSISQYACHRVAVLSDIHSSFYALQACLDDAKNADVDCYIFLGDYVSGLADTEKTLDLVYEIRQQYPAICIRGNRERYMMDHQKGLNPLSRGSKTGSLLFTYEHLREKDLVFFEELPISKTIQLGDVTLEIAHATKDNDRLYFEQEYEIIIDVFQQMHAPYLLTGHSHKQYFCTKNGKTILNPGSVGLPQGSGWKAQYAILDISDGVIHSTLRQVPYDMEATIHAQFQSGLTDYGKCWAIGDLYGALTGEEYTKMLLDKLYHLEKQGQAVLEDEKMWHKFASEMGMQFTEEDVLAFWNQII